jgi:gliding motility-associated protein GldM
MALPKEPRQKMINIMYLVLTALLALNVSAEILNAFKTVDRSLMTASGIAELKNANVFKSFQRKLEDPKTKEKAEIWFPKAQRAKQLADVVYNYVDALKKEMKTEANLEIIEGKEVYREDDLDAPTRLMISDPPTGKAKGKELFKKLSEFRKELLAIDPVMAQEIGANLPLDLSVPKGMNNNPEKKDSITNWTYEYFHMTPAVAAITILSKFQNDIRNSEAQVVEYCHKEIGEVELVYDEFQAFAGTNSQYLMPGEELIITAGVGAFSKAARPTISVDGANVPLKPDGSAEYKSVVGNSGTGTKKVVISFYKPDGTLSRVEKEVKYTVGVPSGLVVSTDKTRVFYRGLDNPLNVTGGGGDEKVNVTVEGPGIASRKVGPGQYIVTATQLGSATVVASDGKNNQRATIPIKRIPDPLATVGGKAGGPIPANVFRVQKGVAAELRDFIFEGVKYDVVSFTFVCTGKGFEESGMAYAPVTGAYFSGEATNLMRRLQPGSYVVIDEIKVKGPDGTTRTLDQNISFTLQ